jgi:hypothetical protein
MPETHEPHSSRGPNLWTSRLLIALAVAAAIPVFFLTRNRPSPGPAPATPPAQSIPFVLFTNITGNAGIHFVHQNGAYGEKLLPETMGSGCAFLDFDNDGFPDLLLVNGTYWQGKIPSNKKPTTPALYRNNQRGGFVEVTAGSGLDVALYGMGVAVGDFDNDGFVDIYITAIGGNRLFRNLGHGKFADVTSAARVGGGAGDWGTSAAWIDYDNDGDLDLFVCNYVRWSREIDLQVDYKLPGVGRAYGPPMNFPGSSPILFRNDGKGKFTDVSASSGIQVSNKATHLPLAKSLGVAPVDLDGDGWIDLIVANDTVQNFVFHNERNGTFKEIGAVAGVAFDNFGSPRGAMGIDTGRFQDDQSLAISIGNFANEMTALYVSQRDPLLFSDEAISRGIGQASRTNLTFGVFFFDYDLDGWLDLLMANGHLEPEIAKISAGQEYRQPSRLFWNGRGGQKTENFILVPPQKVGPDLFIPIVGRGSAYADIDGDGDLDVILTQNAGPPLLLRNDQNLGNHWIRLKLVGTKSNRDAIGAVVKLRVGNKILTQQVMPTRGYLSQSELPITFGLGKESRVGEVQITWPGTAVQTLSNLPIDTLTVVRQL